MPRNSQAPPISGDTLPFRRFDIPHDPNGKCTDTKSTKHTTHGAPKTSAGTFGASRQFHLPPSGAGTLEHRWYHSGRSDPGFSPPGQAVWGASSLHVADSSGGRATCRVNACFQVHPGLAFVLGHPTALVFGSHMITYGHLCLTGRDVKNPVVEYQYQLMKIQCHQLKSVPTWAFELKMFPLKVFELHQW